MKSFIIVLFLFAFKAFATPAIQSMDCSQVLDNGQFWCVVRVTEPSDQVTVLTACRADGERIVFTLAAGETATGVGTELMLSVPAVSDYGFISKAGCEIPAESENFFVRTLKAIRARLTRTYPD